MRQASTTWPTLPSRTTTPRDFSFPRKTESRTGSGRNVLLERGVKTLLADSGYRALCGIECTVDETALSLHGYVHLYYHKQVAQEIASRVAGTRQINNYIRVLD